MAERKRTISYMACFLSMTEYVYFELFTFDLVKMLGRCSLYPDFNFSKSCIVCAQSMNNKDKID